jgi:hypothetical protein
MDVALSWVTLEMTVAIACLWHLGVFNDSQMFTYDLLHFYKMNAQLIVQILLFFMLLLS